MFRVMVLAPPVTVRECAPPLSPTTPLKETALPALTTAFVARVIGPVKMKVSVDPPLPIVARPASTTGWGR